MMQIVYIYRSKMEAEERDETKNVGGNTLGKFIYYIDQYIIFLVNNPRHIQYKL